MLPQASRFVNMLLACVAVTQPRESGSPEPITLHIAKRVAEHRKAAGLTQSELAERVAALGPEWGRTTVAKLESGGRKSVTVQELFALALVFDVPPVSLLADPRSTERVPVAEGLDVEPWPALLWLIGFADLGSTPDKGAVEFGWTDELIYDGVLLVDKFEALDERVRLGRGDTDRENARTKEMHVRALDDIARTLVRLAEAGVPTPALPGYVVDRARELGVKLPGVEG